MITKYRTQAPFAHPFNDLMSGFMGRDISQFFGHDDVAHVSPKVNIVETPEKFIISMLVPGFSKEQLKITAEKDVLTVKAEKAENAMAENERFTRREFQTGAFSRSFKLPNTVDADAISAEQVNGVLQISIPRVEPAKPATRDISIA